MTSKKNFWKFAAFGNEETSVVPGKGGIVPPSGTNADRPNPPINGTIRYNTNLQALEMYQNASWAQISTGSMLKGVENVGGGEDIFKRVFSDIIELKTLVAGSNITLTTSSDTITISASSTGEANTASNIGTGTGTIYKGKVASDLQFKSLKSVNGNLTISNTANEIEFDIVSVGEDNDGGNLGSGTAIYSGKNGTTLEFKTLTENFPIGISDDGSHINFYIENNPAFGGSGAVTISKGDNSERPGAPTTGMIRYNTDSDSLEGYIGSDWSSLLAANNIAETSTNSLLGIDITSVNGVLNIGLDIDGRTELTTPNSSDMILIYDDATSTNKKLDFGYFIDNYVNVSEGTIVVSDIAEFKALDFTQPKYNNAKSLIITDEARGGIFNLVNSGTDDDGITFESTDGNKFAVRKYTGPVNVQWFGAVGDGLTDDSSVIQAALAASNEIYIPKSLTCLLETTVTITDNKTIHGPGTIVKDTSIPHGLHITGDDVTIDGLTFNPKTTSGRPNLDIKLGDGILNPKIVNCTFSGGTYAAIGSSDNVAYQYYPDKGDVDISTNTITLRMAYGPLTDGSLVKIIPVDSNAVAPSPLQFNTPYYVSTSDSQTFSFSLSQGGATIDLTNIGSGRGTIVPNDVDFPYTNPVVGLQVHNNTFDGYSHALYLFFVENFSITDNRFNNSSNETIRLREGLGLGNISDNSFRNSGDDFVDTTWSGQELIISNNICENSTLIFFDIKGSKNISNVEGYQSRDVIITGNIGKGSWTHAVAFGSGDTFEAGDDDTVIWNLNVSKNNFKHCSKQNENGGGNSAYGIIQIKSGARLINIEGNQISECYGAGVYIEDDCGDINIINNDIVNCTDYGIYADSVERLTIAFNRLANVSYMENSDKQLYGVYLNRSDGTFDSMATVVFNTFANNVTSPMGGHGQSGLTQLKALMYNFEVGTNAYAGPSTENRWRQVRKILHGNGTAPIVGAGFVQGDVVLNAVGSTGDHLGNYAIAANTFASFGQIGYRENAGSPIGSLIPKRIGEEVFDTDNSNWYKAVGLTNVDWKLMTT